MADNRQITNDDVAVVGTLALDELTYSGDTALIPVSRLVHVSGAEGSKSVSEVFFAGRHRPHNRRFRFASVGGSQWTLWQRWPGPMVITHRFRLTHRVPFMSTGRTLRSLSVPQVCHCRVVPLRHRFKPPETHLPVDDCWCCIWNGNAG